MESACCDFVCSSSEPWLRQRYRGHRSPQLPRDDAQRPQLGRNSPPRGGYTFSCSGLLLGDLPGTRDAHPASSLHGSRGSNLLLAWASSRLHPRQQWFRCPGWCSTMSEPRQARACFPLLPSRQCGKLYGPFLLHLSWPRAPSKHIFITGVRHAPGSCQQKEK